MIIQIIYLIIFLIFYWMFTRAKNIMIKNKEKYKHLNLIVFLVSVLWPILPFIVLVFFVCGVYKNKQNI